MTTRNRSRKTQDTQESQEAKPQEPQAQETQETQEEAVQVRLPRLFVRARKGFKRFATGVLAPAAGALSGIIVSAIATGIGTAIGAGVVTRMQTRWTHLANNDAVSDDTDGTPADEALTEPEA